MGVGSKLRTVVQGRRPQEPQKLNVVYQSNFLTVIQCFPAKMHSSDNQNHVVYFAKRNFEEIEIRKAIKQHD